MAYLFNVRPIIGYRDLAEGGRIVSSLAVGLTWSFRGLTRTFISSLPITGSRSSRRLSVRAGWPILSLRYLARRDLPRDCYSRLLFVRFVGSADRDDRRPRLAR